MTALLVPIVMQTGNLSNRLRQRVEIGVMTAAQLQWARNRYLTTNIATILQTRQIRQLTQSEMEELTIAGEILAREDVLGLR